MRGAVSLTLVLLAMTGQAAATDRALHGEASALRGAPALVRLLLSCPAAFDAPAPALAEASSALPADTCAWRAAAPKLSAPDRRAADASCAGRIEAARLTEQLALRPSRGP